jgi:H+/Cl- antiporter ClcA
MAEDTPPLDASSDAPGPAAGRPSAVVSGRDAIPATLLRPGAGVFWLAVALIGIGTGLATAALTLLLQAVQHLAWPAHGTLLEAVTQASAWRHILVLLGAGVATGAGQIVLVRLASGNSIDITAAIWFFAGRLPNLRTLGSAVLSVIIVGMGASLGREGAPKQAGAVIANAVADRALMSDEQRRLLVACGAGAGMAAAYGVPLGGALFAIEVLRGVLSLRLILPAVATSLIATAVSWIALPDAATYPIPDYPSSVSIAVWALVAGPIAGVVSVLYVQAVAWADRHKPKGGRRLAAPVLALGLLGLVSIAYPQLLGNGKDVSWLAFTGQVGPALLLALLVLKPAATLLCLGSGAPGGLFTPSLTLGALLGGVLGGAWSWLWPGVPEGAFAFVGAGAIVAATTQGPISAVVLMMELTGHGRTLIVPLLIAVATATMVARTIEPRSIYDARLTDEEVKERLAARDVAPR